MTENNGENRPELLLSELTTLEVERLRDRIELVLLPFGATEQHGPHLALGTDTFIADAFCREASRRLYPRLLVAPPLRWGLSNLHMDFPGTISLSADTVMHIFEDVVDSLTSHGFTRFLILNTHGGNRDIAKLAATEIGARGGVDFMGAVDLSGLIDPEILERHTAAGTGRAGHACEDETSTALYLSPQIVRSDLIAKGQIDDTAWEFRAALETHGVRTATNMHDLTANGALGDPTLATAEMGRERIESAHAGLAELIDTITSST